MEVLLFLLCDDSLVGRGRGRVLDCGICKWTREGSFHDCASFIHVGLVPVW